ncbi:small ribosomal subunit protein mS35 [Sinocyclocheilus rhinocerous]|uniref:Small ribosomal subunit protein mS35 mitochondrial conserved domain-containing protein n=1 Tax=Sinocyclocheilus rhinocerous TaxID=307959 RepID=A0A673K7T9_9TELE|nr:PREDICTED: 28S ribosomal protein S35, mitochondrial [Sinocyclocheilus rhinocerous]
MAAYISHPALSSLCKINCNINGIYSLISFSRRISISSVLSTSAVTTESEAAGRGVRGQRRSKRQAGEPRTERMTVDQDWTAVYPTAASFKPSTVPLPVRMGYPVKRGVPPAKKGNLELIKIPNFLHLTPVAIKKHCEALKQFCTEWPSALDSDEKCMKHFPIQVQSKEFVSAGLSLQNPDARIVTLKVKLSSLNLDDHARKKMIKLGEERYCKDTDTLTITTDSCPLRQQNYDYAMYLLTVLYHESWKTEAWEQEKTRADMEEYEWEDSPSQKNVLDTLLRMRPLGAKDEVEELLGQPAVQEYRDTMLRLKNEGETEENLHKYKEAVKKLFNI